MKWLVGVVALVALSAVFLPGVEAGGILSAKGHLLWHILLVTTGFLAGSLFLRPARAR